MSLHLRMIMASPISRRLENGNISLFDNGNASTPPHSRAIEIQLTR